MTAVTKYRKPPVVEIFIAFEFASNPQKRGWDFEAVNEFKKLHAPQFPKLEQFLETQFHFPTDIPTGELTKGKVKIEGRVKTIRLHDDLRRQFISLEDDRLAFHLVKSGDECPTFGKTWSALEPFYMDYLRLFSPASVQHATVHYVDIIELPIAEDRTVELNEYLTLPIDLPREPYGLVGLSSCQWIVNCPVDPGPLVIQVQDLPRSPEKNAISLRIDWEKQSRDMGELDLDRMFPRLEIVHDYMYRCFEAALTPSLRHTFEPIE